MKMVLLTFIMTSLLMMNKIGAPVRLLRPYSPDRYGDPALANHSECATVWPYPLIEGTMA